MIHGYDFAVIDPKEIPQRRAPGRQSVYLATIREFLLSGAKAAKVEVPGSKSVGSQSSSFAAQIRTHKLEKQVRVTVRGQNVYLVRVTS